TRRLTTVILATLAVASILAVVFRAPLEEAANPSVTPNPAKAPWYFLWLQEIVTDTTLRLGSFTINGALIGGILLPGILVLALCAWPYFDKSGVETTGVWFAKARRKQNVVFLLVVLAVLIFTVIGTFLRGPYWGFYWPWQSWPEMPKKF
ncbi:MAG TPA: cytochrome B6, partial [Acidobacteriota bacterium]|nr:cytochrome B6 [Acidobacteriota bacterium]